MLFTHFKALAFDQRAGDLGKIMGITSRRFGVMPSGEEVLAFDFTSSGGATMTILNLGGIVQSLRVPDRQGKLDEVVIGHDSLAPYLSNSYYLGAMIGRIAGRLPGAKFLMGGQTYILDANNGANHLHGGSVGFDRQIWDAEALENPDGSQSLKLALNSPDGDQGYPGNVLVTLTCSFTAENTFVLESEVRSDRTTPVSLTQHSYFHLGGEVSSTIEDHWLEVRSDRIIAVDEEMTLLGRTEAVDGNACDFRRARKLGDAIPGLFKNHGDMYFLRKEPTLDPEAAARFWHPVSGRLLTVSTTESCLQVYTAKDFAGQFLDRAGSPVQKFAGLCLECEGYPGATGHPEFGSILVSPNTPQKRITRYQFSILE